MACILDARLPVSRVRQVIDKSTQKQHGVNDASNRPSDHPNDARRFHVRIEILINAATDGTAERPKGAGTLIQ
jgi:hypothetical protein